MTEYLKPALRGFAAYVPGDQPPDEPGWVKLNTNESPLPPSPRVLEAVRAAAGDTLRLYPSPTAAPARAAVARDLGVEPDMVVMTNGGDELIAMAIRAWVPAGGRVAFPWPTYPYYEPEALKHEAVPVAHPLGPNWELPRSFIDDEAPLKFLCNPNSPTGHWYPRAVVEEVVSTARGVVVVDEAYVDFAPESRVDLVPRHRNLVVLRTLSKSAALAGMRIGFGIAQPGLVADLHLVRDSYNVDRLAIAAAVAAIDDSEYREQLVDHVLYERDWLSESLSELGFEVLPSATNFIFVRPPAGRSAGEIAHRLAERKVLVRYYDREPIAGWFRITVGTRPQHESLIAALEEILQ